MLLELPSSLVPSEGRIVGNGGQQAWPRFCPPHPALSDFGVVEWSLHWAEYAPFVQIFAAC